MDEQQQARLESELVRDEGEVFHAYQDNSPLRLWTIGVGVMIDARRGGGITREESRYLLRNRLARLEVDLDKAIPWWRKLNPVRQRVLLNMAYNLGVTGLLKFKRALAAAKRGAYAEASRELMMSDWAPQVGPRADRLAAMMRDGY